MFSDGLYPTQQSGFLCVKRAFSSNAFFRLVWFFAVFAFLNILCQILGLFNNFEVLKEIFDYFDYGSSLYLVINVTVIVTNAILLILMFCGLVSTYIKSKDSAENSNPSGGLTVVSVYAIIKLVLLALLTLFFIFLIVVVCSMFEEFSLYYGYYYSYSEIGSVVSSVIAVFVIFEVISIFLSFLFYLGISMAASSARRTIATNSPSIGGFKLTRVMSIIFACITGIVFIFYIAVFFSSLDSGELSTQTLIYDLFTMFLYAFMMITLINAAVFATKYIHSVLSIPGYSAANVNTFYNSGYTTPTTNQPYYGMQKTYPTQNYYNNTAGQSFQPYPPRPQNPYGSPINNGQYPVYAPTSVNKQSAPIQNQSTPLQQQSVPVQNQQAPAYTQPVSMQSQQSAPQQRDIGVAVKAQVSSSAIETVTTSDSTEERIILAKDEKNSETKSETKNESKICKGCGHKIGLDSVFCPYCGHKV